MNFGSKLLALFAALAASVCASAPGEEAACKFDESLRSFEGTPLEQARCLLRPVLPYARLGEPLARLPVPLEDLIGKPVQVTVSALQNYLRSAGIAEDTIGGPITNRLEAKYFVIHDTSSPNYHDQPIPTNINTTAWAPNDLQSAARRPVAHAFVNRLGQSLTPHTWITPWRATKLEVRVLRDKGRGLFVHTEMIQPRRRDPKGGPGNDAIAPTPGFTEPQLDRLALLYTVASVEHGAWMVPAFHACVDAGIPDAHDDPQNFDLALWAQRLALLLDNLKATGK
jgi:hypothetical protein